MTVEDAKVVDIVGVDKEDGEVVLTVSDHLDWQDEATHLSALQEKLNSYLAFVESGELFEKYPNGKGRRVRIEIRLKYRPSRAGERFLRNAQATVAAAGFTLGYKLSDSVQ